MRDRQNQREVSHKPPSTMSTDGMESWYLQQKNREREMRQRRREAEAILRGYRGDAGVVGTSYTKRNGGRRDSSDSAYIYNDFMASPNRASLGGARQLTGTPYSNTSQISSESLDDPHMFKGSQVNYDPDEYEVGINGHNHNLKSRGDNHQLPPKDQNNYVKNQQLQGSPRRTVNSLNIRGNTSDEEKKLDDDYRRVNREFPSPPLTRRLAGQDVPVESVVEEPEPRELTLWLDFISSEPDAKFPPEAGRYHLYLSYACPGSHRVLIVRALKGLEECISVTYVHPSWRLTRPDDPNDKHRGWVFGNPNGEPFPNTIGRGGPFPPAYEGNEPDPNFNAYSIREIYEQAQDTSGKFTIPLLWDRKLNTIVNNESSDIAYMLNSCFNDFATNPDLDLYTEYDEEGVAKLNEVSEWLAPLMIHGVYRCGFAKSQRAYNRAIAELCEAFDRADDMLHDQRYLTGDALTDADIRLFVSLLRFDEVYAVYFKANARLVMLTPNLLNFCRDVYQIAGVAETCNMEQIKAHFYGSHAEWNKYSVIPRGLGFMDLLQMPHDRDSLTETRPFSEC
jgi:glutathionyl-hydroquinone reductase